MSRASIVATATAITMTIGFMALGTWQIERRAWKHELIARVTQRVAAPAVAPPGPAAWPRVDAASDEYRHVRVSGTWLADRSALVQAVTELGSGFWLMTPLRLTDGSVVLVDRGFIMPEARDPSTRSTCDAAGPIEVAGLLRITEPAGGFLRKNDPSTDHWYSRDVAAIGASRGLSNVAPYFIDAAAAPTATAPTCPVGGLTVIAFHDNHLVYALTWFALAAMSALGAWRVVRGSRAMVQDAAMSLPPSNDVRSR